MRETKSVSTALYLDMNEGMGEDEHAYHFVGKVGSSALFNLGCGGGLLLNRRKDGKYYAAKQVVKVIDGLNLKMVSSLKVSDIDLLIIQPWLTML